MKIFQTSLILCCIAAVAGCEVSRGGAGTTTQGDPVTAEVWRNSQLQEGITLTSVDGWKCQGILTPAQVADNISSVYNVPLTCDDGVTGTALASIDRWTDELNINFKLQNGISGSVRIG